ncbi:MAG: hypothetical protein IRY91_16605 [Gemmatimonadaceae bacterium]|nr:hypothetical protein [Gemmatimonadaceae bacterium]
MTARAALPLAIALWSVASGPLAAQRSAARAEHLVVSVPASLGAAEIPPQPRAHRLQPSGRVDVLASRITAVQAGLGLDAMGGRYLRLGIVGGLGGSWDRSTSGLSARVDAVARYVLDPDRTVRWAPYIGGGVGARYDRIADWRAVLILALGVEGPDWNGVVPFIEAGYGGGTRIGLGLRATRPQGR